MSRTDTYAHQAPQFSVGQIVNVKQAREWTTDPRTITDVWQKARGYMYEVQCENGVKGIYCTANVRPAR